MENALFDAIDRYIEDLFVPDDPVLDAALADAHAAGMPDIHVSAGQGKFLYLLAKLTAARRVLEIGTLAAYSTIWLARALPEDGRLTTLEFDPANAKVARNNLMRAGLAERVDVVVGPALDTLPAVESAMDEPFDLVFIDADKANNCAYLDWSLRLTRRGGLILGDNVIRGGAVLDPQEGDTSARGAAAFNRKLAEDPRVEAVVIQQIGVKGHDGLSLAVVR